MSEKGQLSIHAENILPIIKKWLYTEKEIFLRELVANATDATKKLEKIALVEDLPSDLPDAKVKITIDKEKKTLTITDFGVGLSEEEVKKYINQVAFSGVKDFVEKYEGKDESSQIIGHFGLGFYSSFMVAKKVQIESKSYRKDEPAILWTCDGSTEFEIEASPKTEIGTSIILHIDDDSKEMLEAATIKNILDKYCGFMPFPIELEGKEVNDPKPVWTKAPNEVEDKSYLELFHKMFPGSPDPLFWIHLNVDYPFMMRGVLFFPKLQHELDASQGEVKLYCNQVYVADNCKELIPEFLTLLKGALDCPDLPLNVSRSNLQNDLQVRKISQHITKKVADKLTGMAKTEKETFEKYWEDINPFVKFGMLKDQSFYDRMIDFIIFKNSEGKYTTLNQYLDANSEKSDKKIFYATDEKTQATYIKMYKDQGIDVIVCDRTIDSHFLPYIEMHSSGKFKFQRIDSDLSAHVVDEEKEASIVDPADNKTDREKIDELFRNYLKKEKVKVRVEALKSESVPGMIILDENLRRFSDMSRIGAQASSPMLEHTLVVNCKNPAIKNLANLKGSFNKEEQIELIVNQVYDLAYLQHSALSPDMMKEFIMRSNNILEIIGNNN